MAACKHPLRQSGIRLRADIDPEEAQRSADIVIARMREEIARLGEALERQRARYEATLEAERAERRAVMLGRDRRSQRAQEEASELRDENARLLAACEAATWAESRMAAAHSRLQAEHARIGEAYRSSLNALRRSYEQQLEVA